MELADILKNNHTVSGETVEELLRRSAYRTVKKGEAIVTQGERSNSLFFVSEGWFRVSFINDAQERTICFGHDGDPFMSLHSYYGKLPSAFSCIAMTEAKVYEITFDAFDELICRCPDLLMWLKNILVEQLCALERKYVYFSTGDIQSRFMNFVGARPEILNIIPTKYIAQYLDVTPETLYRLRSKLLRNHDLDRE